MNEDILFPQSSIDVFGNAIDDNELHKSNKDRASNMDLTAQSYKKLFAGIGNRKDAEIVMKDLYHVCYGNTTTYCSDAREHAFREGAKNVLIRILNLCKIDASTLYANELNNRKE